MNINQVFPSKWISAADLQGKEPTVTINRVSMEEVNVGEMKPCLWFQGKEKGMILNKTNASNIAFLHGPETDGWVGKPITLFTTWVDFQGKSVEAIRVKPQANPQAMAAQQGNAGQAPAHTVGGNPDFDDEIPF